MNQNLTNNSPIRVAVVDDHPIFTIPFSNMLNSFKGISATHTANSGQELLQLLAKETEKPHIILMDVIMPGMSGIEATRQVSLLYPEIKIAALSGDDDEFSVLR